jgi:hypothetical protein
MNSNEISFNTDLPESIRTRADFTYNITPTMISITDTGLGKCSITEDIEAVLRKIEHWHQGSIAKFKIMCRDGKGFWHGVRWDGKTACACLASSNAPRMIRKYAEGVRGLKPRVESGRCRRTLGTKYECRPLYQSSRCQPVFA